MSCSFNDAKDEMLGVVKAAWDPLGYPIVYPDVAGAPDTGGDAPSANVWARATIRHADGFQASLTGPLEGLKRYSNVGTVIVQVFGKVGDGSVAAYDAAQILATAFRKSRGISVWFRRVRINEVGTSGPFEQINVLATFTYDDVR